MRYQVGVCTWTYGNQPIEETCRSIAELGFDGIELHGDLEQFTAASIRDLMAQHGLKVFSLTPGNVDIIHADSAQREQAMDYYCRLIDFAREIGCPIVSVHGDVGRVSAMTSQQQEETLLLENTARLVAYAEDKGVTLVFEVLNRYESHVINRAEQAVALVDSVNRENFGILLDTYHMNIEEPSPAKAVQQAGNRLKLFHVADSNREGIGHGHTDFSAIFSALSKIDYSGPVIVESTVRGPDPFTPEKEGDFRQRLAVNLTASLDAIRSLQNNR